MEQSGPIEKIVLQGWLEAERDGLNDRDAMIHVTRLLAQACEVALDAVRGKPYKRAA